VYDACAVAANRRSVSRRGGPADGGAQAVSRVIAQGRTLMPMLRIALLLVAACAAQACAQESPTAPVSVAALTPPADWANFTELAPVRATRLSPGAAVSFDVTVSYALTSTEAGRIILALTNQSNQLLQELEIRPVSRGAGTMSFSSRLELPVQGISAVYVQVGLFTDNSISTLAADRVIYPVF
jgi:hypothetical protein